MQITVIAQEIGTDYDDVLIYTVDVESLDADIVAEAVATERERDLGERIEMRVLFAFAGDVPTVADWRA